MPSPKTERKSGTSRAKGAVRGKSGCYTCRIRRKKCDEQLNALGHCKTCVRLHVECLGFGTKRPEWLKETDTVNTLRLKIKDFLTSQGMIKGTSGSAARSSELDCQILRLTDGYSSSSESPETPVLALPEQEFRAGPQISSERDHPYPMLSQNVYSHPSPCLSPLDTLTDDPPFANPARLSDEIISPPYSSVSSHNIVSDLPWPPNVTDYPPQSFPSRASNTRFFDIYDPRINTLCEDYNDLIVAQSPPEYSISYPLFITNPDPLVSHYMSYVMNIQYLLADQKETGDFISRIIQESFPAHEAVGLLSSVHSWCMSGQSTWQQEHEIREKYANVRKLLIDNKSQLVPETQGEAVAGLQVISSYLFSGGKGDWSVYLALASRYCKRILHGGDHSVSYAFMTCSKEDRFIIKATMWFDVLASASQMTVPYFIEEFRELFDPSLAYVEGGSPSEELDMMPVMGCRNYVVWALAEISNLAYWKDEALRQGRLSNYGLIERGLQIDKILRPQEPAPSVIQDDVESNRHLTSEIFRASARLYLHSVISNDYPGGLGVMAAVDETMEMVKRVPVQGRSVLRSVVFSIYICGCFTNNPEHRDTLKKRLSAEAETVGNVKQVQDLLNEVWAERDKKPHDPVPWRKTLQNATMLLV